MGEDHAGAGGCHGIVAVFPDVAGLQDDVLWTREGSEVVDQVLVSGGESGLVEPVPLAIEDGGGDALSVDVKPDVDRLVHAAHPRG